MDVETVWVNWEVAASVLGIGRTRLRQLAQAGQVRREAGRGRGGTYGYCLRSVDALAESRERQDWGREQARRKRLHGVHHTTLEAAPGDRLIPCAEAAEWLGVSRKRVGQMVERGYLFAYQTKLGQKGSRLFLSARQVQRVAESVEHRSRRAVYERSVGQKAAAREHPRWGIRAYDWYAPSAATGRDYGLYYTTRQAALLLGVSRNAVDWLRIRGRLTGYRHVTKYHRKPGGNPWWFFRKDEVNRLRLSPEYRRRHLASTEGITAARQERLEREIEVCWRVGQRFRRRLESFPVD